MQFTIVHTNLNVFDLDKSLAFYREVLGLSEVRRVEANDARLLVHLHPFRGRLVRRSQVRGEGAQRVLPHRRHSLARTMLGGECAESVR